MALVPILDGVLEEIGWSYENTSTINGGVAGIRTNPDGTEIYVECVQTNHSGNVPGTGEISKSFYDNEGV